MIALSPRPFCPCDGHQTGLLYLPARWRDTTNSRSTWGSSRSCTTSASEAKRCFLRSLSSWSRKTLESNMSVREKPFFDSLNEGVQATASSRSGSVRRFSDGTLSRWREPMELHLRGRTVLVTGASKGIGLGIAQCFAQEGCHLRLVARSGDLLARESEALRTSCDVDVQTLALDLSTEASRQRLTDAWPDIDVLVNNAGDIPGGAIDAVDDAAWRACWDLKVFGYLAFSRFYLA